MHVYVHVCIYVAETFSTLMVDSDMAAGYAASLSMGLDTDTKSLHIRGSVQTPPTVRGKRPLSLEILRERRLLYTEEITVALSDNVSSCRSEEHTSELQSRETISYAVFCLKKKNSNCLPP